MCLWLHWLDWLYELSYVVLSCSNSLAPTPHHRKVALVAVPKTLAVVTSSLSLSVSLCQEESTQIHGEVAFSHGDATRDICGRARHLVSLTNVNACPTFMSLASGSISAHDTSSLDLVYPWSWLWSTSSSSPMYSYSSMCPMWAAHGPSSAFWSFGTSLLVHPSPLLNQLHMNYSLDLLHCLSTTNVHPTPTHSQANRHVTQHTQWPTNQ